MKVLIKLSDAIKTLKSMAVPLVRKLPFAQPERLTDYSFEESCTDCPAYDTENHRCPRFNQVIRRALKDANLEPCEDCISRQAAIDYCYALINAENPSDPSDEWNYSQERINQTEVILHHLEFMPSARPELRRGEES